MKNNSSVFVSIFSLILTVVFLSNGSLASFNNESVVQNFSIRENGVTNVKFLNTLYFNQLTLSESFNITSINISNIRVSDSNESLNWTESSTGYFIVNFPRLFGPNDSYTFSFEFDSYGFTTLPSLLQISQVSWSWGGADYPINITYNFELPAFYDSVLNNKIYQNNKTILVFNGIVQASNYFNASFSIQKLSPPNLEITKNLDKSETHVGDITIIEIRIKNNGGSAAENVSFYDKIPPFFKLEGGTTNWSGNLNPEEIKNIQYSVSSIIETKNKKLESAKASFTDLWNSKVYYSESNIESVTILEPTKFIDVAGIQIPLPPAPFNNPSIWIYVFFLGYGTLLWLVKIRKNIKLDWHKLHTIDRIIYGFIVGIINSVVAIIIYFVLLLIWFAFTQTTQNITNDFKPYILMFVTIPITAWLIEKHFMDISSRKIYILFGICVAILFFIFLLFSG